MKKSDYIKSLFRDKKIKIKDVALKMGISPSTLSAKINGHRVFKEKEIQILLSALDMTYEKVFQQKEIKIIDDDKKVITIDGQSFEISKDDANTIITKIKEVI